MSSRAIAAIAAAVAALALGGCAGLEDSGGGGATGSQAAKGSTEKPAAQATPQSAWARVRAAMRDEFGKDLVSLKRSRKEVAVTLKAGDNLTSGMIRTGIKLDAEKAFKAIHDAGYKPKSVTVNFTFPLVDKATGKESVDVVATYFIDRASFREVNWDNSDAVDWDFYRAMLHPALQ